jgi:hypothetical protein
MPGVVAAEGIRAVPIRIRHEHRMREVVAMGFAEAATLRRLICTRRRQGSRDPGRRSARHEDARGDSGPSRR